MSINDFYPNNLTEIIFSRYSTLISGLTEIYLNQFTLTFLSNRIENIAQSVLQNLIWTLSLWSNFQFHILINRIYNSPEFVKESKESIIMYKRKAAFLDP